MSKDRNMASPEGAAEASEVESIKADARVAATAAAKIAAADDYWRNKIADTEQVFLALVDAVGNVTVDVPATGRKALDAFLDAEAKAWRFLYGSRPNPRTATRATTNESTPATPRTGEAESINQTPATPEE